MDPAGHPDLGSASPSFMFTSDEGSSDLLNYQGSSTGGAPHPEVVHSTPVQFQFWPNPDDNSYISGNLASYPDLGSASPSFMFTSDEGSSVTPTDIYGQTGPFLSPYGIHNDILAVIRDQVSEQATPEGSIVYSTTETVKPARGKGKPKKRVTLRDFPGPVKDMITDSKRAYVAILLLQNAIPTDEEKKNKAREAYLLVLNGKKSNPEVRIDPQVPPALPDGATQLLHESYIKVRSDINRQIDIILVQDYGLHPDLPQQAKNNLIQEMLGIKLTLIWDQVDVCGNPIPFGHQGLTKALEFLHFQTTGVVGVVFESWFGDRYTSQGAAYVLTLMDHRARVHSTDPLFRREDASLVRTTIEPRFTFFLGLLEGVERDAYYQDRFIKDMQQSFTRGRLAARVKSGPVRPAIRPVPITDVPAHCKNFAIHTQSVIHWGMLSERANRE